MSKTVMLIDLRQKRPPHFWQPRIGIIPVAGLVCARVHTLGLRDNRRYTVSTVYNLFLTWKKIIMPGDLLYSPGMRKKMLLLHYLEHRVHGERRVLFFRKERHQLLGILGDGLVGYPVDQIRYSF